MAENNSVNSENPKIRYPNLLIGYVLAVFTLLWQIINPRDNTSLSRIYISAAGVIYFYWCVFRVHRIMKKITGGSILPDASQAALYLFIPLFNSCWSFVWIRRIARFLNEIQGSKKIKAFFPSVVLSVSLFPWIAFLPLTLLGGFSVLFFLIKKIQETVALDETGAKIIAANISQFKPRKKTKKSVFWRLVKITAIILFFIFANLPRLLLFPVHRVGIRLVPLIENYKTEHGVYPDSLSQLGGEMKYQDVIEYKIYEGKTEFLLVCRGGWTFRAVYHSTTKNWDIIN